MIRKVLVVFFFIFIYSSYIMANEVDLTKIKNTNTKTEKGEVKVTIPANVVASKGGIAKRISLSKVYDELNLEYKFTFGNDFDFSEENTNGPKKQTGKLPGLSGGVENTGGIDDPLNLDRGWSVRINWRKDGLLNLYTYHLNQKDVFADDLQLNLREVKVIPGKTYKAIIYVKMNDIGKKNGILELWIDDQKVAEYSNIEFKNNQPKSDSITEIHFSVFIGGGNQDWGHPKDETITIKDMKYY